MEDEGEGEERESSWSDSQLPFSEGAGSVEVRVGLSFGTGTLGNGLDPSNKPVYGFELEDDASEEEGCESNGHDPRDCEGG